MTKDFVIEEKGRGGIVLYQSPDGKANLDVKLENESVWLTQAQMALLFEKDQSVIARHVKNALTEGEIDSSNMQILHNTLSKYKPTTVYNLDVIISVGYRVHSPQGVHFRRWVSTVLKDYLIKGYAVKSNIYKERYDDLRALVDTMGRTMQYIETGDDDQIKSIFDVVRDYTYALDTAATLFLWFMENNGILYAANGAKRIADNALVALTLMIAESKTDEMDMMVKVVVNLINTRN